MKFRSQIFISMLLSLSSCDYINAFNDHTIPIGSSGAVLVYFAENDNYFFAKQESKNSFSAVVEGPVISVKGNDSVLFVRRGNSLHSTFYMVDMWAYHPEAHNISKWDYENSLKKIKLKYDISPR